MYYIIKDNNDGDTVNIVSDPSTGHPLGFYDVMDAVKFSEKFGFAEEKIDIVDLDEKTLRAIA